MSSIINKIDSYLDKKVLNEDKDFHVRHKEKPESGASQDIGDVSLDIYPGGDIEIRAFNKSRNEYARVMIPKEQAKEFLEYVKKQLKMKI